LVGYERVKRIGALADGGKGEAFGQIHRHVFNRMHSQIGATVLQGLFQLFDKQAFAADFRQGWICFACHMASRLSRLAITSFFGFICSF